MQEAMRRTVFQLLSGFLLFFDLNVFGETEECGGNFTNVLQGIVLFSSEDFAKNIECQWSITGPSETHVQVVLRKVDVNIGNDSYLNILDGGFGKIITLKNDWAKEGSSNLYVNSLTNSMLLTFATSNSSISTSFTIPFEVQLKSIAKPFTENQEKTFSLKGNSTTTYTKSSGIVASNGTANEPVINYVHTHQIDIDHVNGRVYLFLEELLLNDALGDFIAIGSDDDVLNSSPAILLTGKRTKALSIAVENNNAYLHVYAWNFTQGSGYSFYYNSSVYVPPTDEPPTTPSPPVPLNATFNFNIRKDNIKTVVSRFVSAIGTSAVRYCRGDFLKNGSISSAPTVDVIVVEAVYSESCVVLVFYAILQENTTCLNHTPFTLEDYYCMMGNYSSSIEKDFGRPILQTCLVDVSIWVLFVAIILCFSLTITIIVAVTKQNYSYKKLTENEVMLDDTKIKKNPIFGVKVNNDENPYVMWSESERPSIATISPLKIAEGRRYSLPLKKGFLNHGFVSDSPEKVLKEEMLESDLHVTFGVDNDDNDDKEVDAFDNCKLSQGEVVVNDFFFTCNTDTPPETPSTELTNDNFDEPEDALNVMDNITMDETKL